MITDIHAHLQFIERLRQFVRQHAETADELETLLDGLDILESEIENIGAEPESAEPDRTA